MAYILSSKNDPLKEIIPIFGQLEQHLAAINGRDSPNLVVITVLYSTCLCGFTHFCLVTSRSYRKVKIEWRMDIDSEVDYMHLSDSASHPFEFH